MKSSDGKDFWSDIAAPDEVVARARDGDSLERWAAIFALGDIDQPWTVDELRRLSEDPENLVSQAARAALKRLHEVPSGPARTRRQFGWVVRQYTRRLADRAALPSLNNMLRAASCC